MIILYDRIFSVAKEKGIQQKDFAEYLGVKPSVISGWKSGRLRPSVEYISKLADYFGVSTDYLLGKTDDRNYQELVIPQDLDNVRVAFHRGGIEDLTQEEVDKLAEFAQFLKSQRKK